MKRLLLLSNSSQHGHGYLEHATPEIQDFLGDAVERVLFVPYALADWDGYLTTVRAAFEGFGYGVEGVHEANRRLDTIHSRPHETLTMLRELNTQAQPDA